MTARSFIVRCSHCKTSTTVNATLENARQMRCGTCHQKVTVSGYQDDGKTTQGEPAAVTVPPGIEKADWRNTEDQDKRARSLVISALGEGA